MAKTSILFACTNCDAQYPAWQGRCTECGAWGTVQEIGAVEQKKRDRAGRVRVGETVLLDEVRPGKSISQPTGIAEVDRVLSGGLVEGSLTLLGGPPGIGKSTLVLQIAAAMAEKGEVLYVSGEESKEQLKLRYDRLRLSVKGLRVLPETDVEAIIVTIGQLKPRLAIVDSIQTVTYGDVPGEPGGVTQIKAATVRLLQTAKTTGTAILLVGHVTKEGFVAGPKMLEHLVDTVLYLEGDESLSFRLLRAVKHRFGVTDEVGVFAMTDRGLEAVANPSELFLLRERSPQPGTAVTVVLEGTRPFLLEVQALVSPTSFGYPKRLASGFDRGRLELLLAVLTKRTGLKLGTSDVHVNLVGGLKVKEPAIDLAVCLAVASGVLDRALPPSLVLVGEVGLGGELRIVSRLDERLREASKLGFHTAGVPNAPKEAKKLKGSLTIQPVSTLSDAMRVFLGG